MAALPNLITVAQFWELAEDSEYCYELHHGEVVTLTWPKAGHSKLQLRLMMLLRPKLRRFGEVTMEWGYRPLAEFEFRVADVAAVSRKRWDDTDPDDNLRGAPELVIEVKSPSNPLVGEKPSNRKSKLRELATLCLANGSLQFWIVDQEHKSVTVVRRDGSTVVYGLKDEIPLLEFGAAALPVSKIFG